ncbi:uncharacterized protein B0H18DRAFT_1036788 [Fomitopsis serialis]|uniref:uncharacterized protein n=1 Tax=Fomitopsis serialis TaxID=139415 RepID=UPI002007B6D8|nr:uncharacterized protein B0H18DRAFT_1036788 [Neoantrodia serialis]KAH9916887.1 hypothetical protein B0H18DRAFT_1036788 [Neoantrodia serialis]
MAYPIQQYKWNDLVWSAILSFTQLDDARSLSLTCRDIYPLSRRAVLSRAEPSTFSQVQTICSYKLADPRNRAWWLHELCVSIPAKYCSRVTEEPEPLPVHTSLANLLEAAPNLRILSLCDMDRSLQVEPRFGRALISLRCLHTLKLGGMSRPTLELARKMASRPSDVTLEFVRPFFYWTPDCRDIASLSNLPLLDNAHTVHIDCLGPLDGRLYRSRMDLGSHPSVRKVRLGSGGSVLPLHRLFPSMQSLYLTDINVPFWEQWAWPQNVPLVEVNATVAALKGFTNATVRSLHIQDRLDVNTGTRRDGFGPLRAMRPVCLSVGSGVRRPREPASLKHWASFLTANLGPEGRLRCLELEALSFRRAERPLPFVKWLLPFLVPSALVCVKLHFNFNRAPRSGAPELPHRAQQEVDAARRMLVDSVPSLQYICIVAGYRHPDAPSESGLLIRVLGECTWWRISTSTDTGERRVERISDEAGALVDRYMRSAEFEETLTLDRFVLAES